METQALQIVRRGRFWAVYDGAGQLVCVAVYQKGAREVVRRLSPASLTSEQSGLAGPPTPAEDDGFAKKEKPHGTRHASDDRHR